MNIEGVGHIPNRVGRRAAAKEVLRSFHIVALTINRQAVDGHLAS